MLAHLTLSVELNGLRQSPLVTETTTSDEVIVNIKELLFKHFKLEQESDVQIEIWWSVGDPNHKVT